MAIFDLFSTSFLVSLLIIIILMCSVFAYVTYRMSEQDHKLTSMVNLVSILAQDLRMVRSKLSLIETDLQSNKLQYPSDMMGGKDINELISVSDDESQDYESQEDDIQDDDSQDDNTQDDNYSLDETQDDDECEDNNECEDDTQEKIKLLNLTLVNEDIDNVENIINDFEELDTFDNNDIKTIHIEASIDYNEPTNSINLDSKDIVNENINLDINNNFDFKNITINDLDEDIQSFKTDYKKMSLNKLREVVVSKGIIADASKLKKNDILKMLGDE